MLEYKLSGFPNEFSSKIEMPSIEELLKMPWYQYASAEDVQKHGGEFYKELISRANLKNKSKYVAVTARVQYLIPSYTSIIYDDKWHIDGRLYAFDDNEDVMHLLLSDCTALTEFNELETSVFLPQGANIKHLNNVIKLVNLRGKTIEPNQFVTFGATNAHRAIQPTKPEFRFMFRIVESDIFEPRIYDEACSYNMAIYQKTENSVKGYINMVKDKHNNEVTILDELKFFREYPL